GRDRPFSQFFAGSQTGTGVSQPPITLGSDFPFVSFGAGAQTGTGISQPVAAQDAISPVGVAAAPGETSATHNLGDIVGDAQTSPLPPSGPEDDSFWKKYKTPLILAGGIYGIDRLGNFIFGDSSKVPGPTGGPGGSNGNGTGPTPPSTTPAPTPTPDTPVHTAPTPTTPQPQQAPYVPPRVTVSPYTIGVPTGGQAGRIFNQDYYCITSITPVVVVSVPAGTPFPSNCYNNGTAGPVVGNQQFAQQAPPTNPLTSILGGLMQGLAGLFSGGNGSNSGTHNNTNAGGATPTPAQKPPVPVVTLVANPRTVASGEKALLSWSSVGMTKCDIFGQGDGSLASGISGSTSTPALMGVSVFTVRCISASGATTTAKVSVGVE
ncbi:hypothetical protein HY418_01925, partial [Candidatus Kaiserbacteria bacterium]|nr:hypothetical protein [Candidatus Kaiserbacteria bacterium]